MFEDENMLTLEQTQELYKYLKGESVPGGIRIDPPKLESDKAFGVIYILQQHFHIIPDTFEQCAYCKEIYDSYQEGYYHDCDGCEEMHCIDYYPDVSKKTLKKLLNGRHFCNDGCEQNYVCEKVNEK